MNKHIPTAAAALALVCAVGFSYAQSTQDPSTTAGSPVTQTDPAPQDTAVPPPDAPASSTMGSTQATPADSMSNTSPTANDSSTYNNDMSTERAPQADRN